jgi:hypothetical protein
VPQFEKLSAGIEIVTRKTEPRIELPDALYFLKDLQTVRVSDIVDPVEAEEDEVERTIREHLHRSGIAHGERNVIRISREPSPAFVDHALSVVHTDVFADPFGKMESRAATAYPQVQHPRRLQMGEQQSKNGFFRRLEIGLRRTLSGHPRKTINVLIAIHDPVPCGEVAASDLFETGANLGACPAGA